MTEQLHLGIRFPDRAESLDRFEGYRVFLDHWDPFSQKLREFYEGLALRGETRALAVYGPQGAGKTLFAKKLTTDFSHCSSGQLREYQDENLWHRMTARDRNPQTAQAATVGVKIILADQTTNWKKQAETWLGERPNHRCIIIVDEADQAHFRQSLVDMSDIEFAQHGDTPAALKLAAQRFVKLCRTTLRGSLFLILTNNEQFLGAFSTEVEAQHRGLLHVERLPLPGSRDKETVVRVNTNRLNPFSYWFCLDKAGPDEKRAVYEALNGAATFPDSFAAVSRAISTAGSSRIGRPARKCILSLVVLFDGDNPLTLQESSIGTVHRVEIAHKWLKSIVYNADWATAALGFSNDSKLLESEWDLRLILLGRPFTGALLQDGTSTHCQSLLNALMLYHGPGTHEATREGSRQVLRDLVDQWPDTTSYDQTAFWAAGQARSGQYEPRLAQILPGYNTGHPGFLDYRPDFVISNFHPCSILSAADNNQDSINYAIRRTAHVYEFTALKDLTVDGIKGYLASKLGNYVKIVREQ